MISALIVGGDSIVFVISTVEIVFFFKQKTAYELRISDWSSDVCSSDLPDCAVSTIACPFVRASISSGIRNAVEALLALEGHRKDPARNEPPARPAPVRKDRRVNVMA